MMQHTTPRHFRYDTSGRWYKGNTHIHTTRSDGGMTFAEVTQLYAGAGFDFLSRRTTGSHPM